MDSAYIEMALPNCPLEVGECKNGAESVSSLTAFSNSSSLMHALEPSLDVVDVKLEPDLSEDMPPPNAIPGLAQFTTVEFSGFAQTPSSGTSDAPAGESFPGSAVSSAAGELSEGQGSSTSSAAVLAISQPVFQTPQHESSGQYVQQSHVLDHRPGSAVSASPGPSCGSGGSPAPSTSLSHPSVGSPWSFDVSCMPNSDNPAATSSLPSTTTTATTSVATVSALPSQSTDAPKLEKPQPPKKPLTPYMRFSKAIWQQVKAAHPSLSVCEVGAAIGKMWREMIETEKQRYNEDFAIDKVRYDDELQSYLKLTGLQASDLSKPKAKKKDTKLQTPLRPTNKPQVMPFATAEQMSGGAVAPGDHATPEPLATTVAVPGTMNGAALRATGFQTVGVGEDCSSVGTNLSTLPHFSQVWSGQEVYANQQLLAQMGFTPGQTIFTNHTMGGEAANTSGLITIQSQDVSQNEGPQVTALYSGQSQPLQNVGSQGVASHVQMSVGQIDNSNVMTSSDNAWLWQQYNTGNQFLQDAMTAQSSLPQSQNHDGVIIYQITSSDGAQSSLVQPSMESDLQANHQSLSGVVLAKPSSVAATNGTAEAVLEPGEVPLSGQTVGSNGPIEPGVYDLNQLCGLMSWNQTKDEKLRGFVQPVDGEKQLLRSALLEKSKEIQRLTRELELAYGLIHQLKQQNDLFQRHWNGQQQMQQQQQQQQQQLQQQQLQQQQLQQQQQQQLQQQLYIIPKTESTTGLSIST